MEHIIIRGPLGVGKSTIARELAEKLDYKYLSLDEIINSNNLVPLNVDGVPIESFMESNSLLLELSRGAERPLVIDGCFYCQEQIDDLIDKLDEKVIVFSLNCSVEECIKRDSRRTKTYGEDATKFVHMLAGKVKAGSEIDTTNLSASETLSIIMKRLKL